MKQAKLVFSSLVNVWNSGCVPVKRSHEGVALLASSASGNIPTALTLYF